MDHKQSPIKAYIWALLTFLAISVAYNTANVWTFLGGEAGSNAYWDFQAYAVYISRFWWALSLTIWVPITFPNLIIKYLGLAATVSLGIDILDLIFTGDYNPNWLDTLFWFLGVPYSLVSYRIYRRALISDKIEPGGVYVVSNAPRDLIQLAVSFTPWGKGRGNLAVYHNGGYYFASASDNKYQRHALPRLIIREGQVVKRIDVSAEEFSLWWDRWEGRGYSWRRNCFRAVGDLG